nr:hypothetical protein Iba_chr09eCG3580 [Ipomoea batatas]
MFLLRRQHALNSGKPTRVVGDEIIGRCPLPRNDAKLVVVLFHPFHEELPEDGPRPGFVVLCRLVHDLENELEEFVALVWLDFLVFACQSEFGEHDRLFQYPLAIFDVRKDPLPRKLQFVLKSLILKPSIRAKFS